MKIKKYILITILFNSLLSFGQWTQIGSDIDGEAAGDNSGHSVSLNSSGDILAIGAYGNEENGLQSGHVRIYKNINNNWTQIGNDIDGEESGDRFGWSLSLNDLGNIIAIGAVYNDGNEGSNHGHVRVFENINNIWVQVGNDIDGENSGDNSGHSVSLNSAGNIVVIGANYNDGNGSNSGHVRVFENINNTWVQVGNDINGENEGDEFGYSVAISSDGNIIAAGANRNAENGTNSGHVRVFKNIDSNWIQIGNDIDGEMEGDQFGLRVSLNSTGNTVAIGAYHNDGNGSNSGHVRIFENTNDTWSQIGDDIDGEAAGDFSGISVDLSSTGNIVAIGAERNSNKSSGAGHVRVFENINNNWIKIGEDIDGEAQGDFSGVSVSLSSNGKVAIGSKNNDGNGSNSGHVRVFENSSVTLSNEFIELENFEIGILNSKIIIISKQKLELHIYNLNGIEVKNENLKTGIYFLKIIDEKRKETTKKVLVN